MRSGAILVLVVSAIVFLFALFLVFFRTWIASLLHRANLGAASQPDPLAPPPLVRVAKRFLLVVGLLGILISVAMLAIGLSVTL